MTDSNDNALVITDIQRPAPVASRSVYSDVDALADAQRIGNALCSSAMVPAHFQGAQNMANVLWAIEMAKNIGVSVISVMQSLYIVHGKPNWSSQAMIAMVNGCGRFSALRFDLKGEGKGLSCKAFATEKATGETLDGPEVTWAMAEAEGWTRKSGSKWLTMPALMIRYRAAAFWARLYVPEMLMGYMTAEEAEDIEVAQVSVPRAMSQPSRKRREQQVQPAETKEENTQHQPEGDGGPDPLD